MCRPMHIVFLPVIHPEFSSLLQMFLHPLSHPLPPLALSLSLSGDSEWQIDDPRTWRDPHGEDKEQPIGETDSFYLQGGPSDESKRESETLDGSQFEDSMQVASVLLSDSKARQKDDTIGKSAGLHSLLRVRKQIDAVMNEAMSGEVRSGMLN